MKNKIISLFILLIVTTSHISPNHDWHKRMQQAIYRKRVIVATSQETDSDYFRLNPEMIVNNMLYDETIVQHGLLMLGGMLVGGGAAKQDGGLIALGVIGITVSLGREYFDNQEKIKAINTVNEHYVVLQEKHHEAKERKLVNDLKDNL